MSTTATTIERCWACYAELVTENMSEEHVIPNALGGRLSSRRLLCRPCNSGLGQEVDVALIDVLNVFAVLGNIRRDRGKPPSEVVSIAGTEFDLAHGTPGGFTSPRHPVVTRDGDHVQIVAGTRRRVLQEVQRFAKEGEVVMRDEPRRAAEEGGEAQQRWTCTRDAPISLLERGLAKIAVNFARLQGVPVTKLDSVISFVRGQRDAVSTVTLSKERACPGPVHMVVLWGDPGLRVLLATVSLFGTLLGRVVLDNHYDGPLIEKAHAIDVTRGRELHTCVSVSLVEK